MPISKSVQKPKCEIFNYIPHETPKNITYKKWSTYYKRQIIDMFIILVDTVDSKYQRNNIDWDSEKIFKEFSYMLYESSSKYIMDNDEHF
jgi:hypothetical protein